MNNSYQIIIDPGHGGSETGAVGLSGYVEKNLNLTISLKLNDILKKYFNYVVMTRTTDKYFSVDNRAYWVKDKADNFNGKTICLSIHLNAFDQNARGAETIYSVFSDDKLARSICNKICELGIPFRNVYSRNSETHPNEKMDYYAIHRLTGSAQTVIVESLFIDNASDITFIKQDGFIDKLAEKIAEGLLNYLNITEIKEEPKIIPVPIPEVKVVEPPKPHWAKVDNDELLAAGLIKSDHTSTLDNTASEGLVLHLINELRKVGK